jgi:hypothetical protein
MTTGLGRVGGGAVGAMFIESISMGLLEQREHSGTEVVTRLGRSAVLGGGSVWVGAAAGSAVGSVVPVAGTAVGFIVGLVVGGALYYIGDKLVPGGREDWDAIEAGCTPLPSRERWRGSGGGDTGRFFVWCFLGSTRVSMADGSRKAIEAIEVGDRVLSYNEEHGRLEARRVEKVHAMPPADHLVMHFSNGNTLRVTPFHKLLTPSGWRAAAELRPGDGVYSSAADDEVEPETAMGIAYLENCTSAPASEGVYDLTVETTHTYFAESVLAHNKMR